MGLKEDDLCNKLVEHFQNKGFNHIEPEAHYNNYGDRGVADLYAKRPGLGKVIELKSNPNKANSVLRQFNRMRKHFFKDEDREKPRQAIYELCFIPTEENFHHLVENKWMYSQLQHDPKVELLFRKLDEPSVIHPVFREDGTEIGDGTWRTQAEEMGFNLNRSGAEKEYYSCPYCEKEYQNRSYFKKHTRNCSEKSSNNTTERLKQ